MNEDSRPRKYRGYMSNRKFTNYSADIKITKKQPTVIRRRLPTILNRTTGLNPDLNSGRAWICVRDASPKQPNYRAKEKKTVEDVLEEMNFIFRFSVRR